MHIRSCKMPLTVVMFYSLAFMLGLLSCDTMSARGWWADDSQAVVSLLMVSELLLFAI